MIESTTSRTGGQTAPDTSDHNRNNTGIASRVKTVIVTLAIWGWLPLGLADRINRMGGTHND